MSPSMTWVGILLCLSQSAMFSGLTLGFFGLSRLRLEVESATKDKKAFKILQIRKDSNFLLATLLWGNVGVNVLLTLLTDSVLAGVSAFVFSTVGITVFGEIVPQAYMSRHALRAGVLFIPVIKFYQILLYPVAKPTAYVLDKWLGKEGVHYMREVEVITLIKKHIKAFDSDLDIIEGIGAINFLTLDDVKVVHEGEALDPKSLLRIPFENGHPVFSDPGTGSHDGMMEQVKATDKKWVVLTDESDQPHLVLDADAMMRQFVKTGEIKNPIVFCHRPIMVTEDTTTIGEVIREFTVHGERAGDDVIDHDVILYWNGEKRIITGADILGSLLKGIVRKKKSTSHNSEKQPQI